VWELRFEITSEKWTILEVVLSKLEPAAITTAYGDTDLFHSYSNVAKISHWEKLEVIVLFKDLKQVDLACSFLVKVEGVSKSLRKRKIREDVDWNLEWRKNWTPITLLSGLHISPSWLPIPAQVANTVRLDPGQAFGTGTHETTRLCLNYLDSFEFSERLKMIDYGCGSGILSLVAAALGCKQITATDNDPQALEITKKNTIINSQQQVITVDVPENITMEKCDLLVANILLDALLSLKDVFSKLVRKHGFLVLSGVMTPQAEILVSTYGSEFVKQEVKILNDWCILVFTKR
tara:strand:+ start:1227 stop:2102 length:876 start_codon:yes stop_codon:yes gene_type:complete